MKTKYAAGVILTGLVCAGMPSAQSGGAEVMAPPNIVFIMADDLGFSDLGCYGGEAATPNLDRLAAEGVRFSQYYNCGKCEPTRAALMTGHRNTPQIGFLAERAKTFMPAVLKDQGYRTILAGKWHVSRHPLDRGFERFFGMEEGACDYYTGSGRLQLGREKFPVPAAGFYTTDAFTDHALKFLDEAKTQNDAQPFFLYLAYNAPHDPLQVPEEELAKYRGKYLEGWEVIQQRRFARIKKTGLVPPEARLPLWPQNLPHWTELTDAQKTSEDLSMATYTAMIDRMDQNIGRVLQWLEKNNERENTLIVFVSDNGANPFGRLGTAWAHVCDTPFRLYKRNQHEGGICAPMILRGPASGYAAGSVSTLPVHVLDFLPTFYALAGGTGRPEDIEGTDLSGLWKTGAQNRDYEMMNYLADHRYIRRNDWKLVSVDGQSWELYNISRDRTETDNLIAKNPEKAQELQAAWEKWYNSFSKKTVEAGKVTKRSHMGDQGSGIRYDPSASPKTEEE
ncbi:MAG: arylsulfatase [Kiritimatiellales bacterium]